MKKLKILFGTVILSAGLASCSSAYYASAGYASDDLYAVHDRAEISRRKQAEAEAQRAAAEARRAEWEARIAEAKAAAAENSYYEYRSADANPYESVLADDYESAYARRLRGFESPTYKMPSSYINARYGSAFNYVSAYDPAFYNIVVMGDQVWVEPKYITSMFGSWGTVIYSDPWYYGWNRPWGPSLLTLAAQLPASGSTPSFSSCPLPSLCAARSTRSPKTPTSAASSWAFSPA